MVSQDGFFECRKMCNAHAGVPSNHRDARDADMKKHLQKHSSTRFPCPAWSVYFSLCGMVAHSHTVVAKSYSQINEMSCGISRIFIRNSNTSSLIEGHAVREVVGSEHRLAIAPLLLCEYLGKYHPPHILVTIDALVGETSCVITLVPSLTSVSLYDLCIVYR